MKRILFQSINRYQNGVPEFSIVEVEDGSMEEMAKAASQKWDTTFPFEEERDCMAVVEKGNCYCLYGEETDYIFTVID